MESGASEGAKDVKKHSPMAMILLGGGFLLSAIVVLLGVGSLVLALLTLADNPCYADYMAAFGEIFLALVLLVPGILGLRACIRRLRAMRSSSAGRQMAYLLVAPVALCVLAGIALAVTLAVKPMSGDHLQLQRLAGRKSFAEIKLAKAELRYADLSGSDLSGSDLSGSELYEVDLTGADLSQANLSEANLRWANLSRADLIGANLYGADLYRANLYGADLSGADLTGADLSGTDLTGATVTDEQLAQAASLKGATLPDGTVHE